MKCEVETRNFILHPSSFILSSATDLRHGARVSAGSPRVSELEVNFWFNHQQLADLLSQVSGVNTVAKGSFQINLTSFIEKTGAQPAVSRKAHSVAAIAETFRHLTDKSQSSQSAGNLEDISRSIAPDV